MSETKENTREETETEVHKSTETRNVDGKETIHEEEETIKKTKIEKNNTKMIQKDGRGF